MINEDILDTMVRTAIDAMRNAYTEHGARAVGACVLASDGTLYTGCTVDNASPQLVMNAEAVAIARAVADGMRNQLSAHGRVRCAGDYHGGYAGQRGKSGACGTPAVRGKAQGAPGQGKGAVLPV